MEFRRELIPGLSGTELAASHDELQLALLEFVVPLLPQCLAIVLAQQRDGVVLADSCCALQPVNCLEKRIHVAIALA